MCIYVHMYRIQALAESSSLAPGSASEALTQFTPASMNVSATNAAGCAQRAPEDGQVGLSLSLSLSFSLCIHIPMSVYVHIYIYTDTHISHSLSLSLYIYVHMCVHYCLWRSSQLSDALPECE